MNDGHPGDGEPFDATPHIDALKRGIARLQDWGALDATSERVFCELTPAQNLAMMKEVTASSDADAGGFVLAWGRVDFVHVAPNPRSKRETHMLMWAQPGTGDKQAVLVDCVGA